MRWPSEIHAMVLTKALSGGFKGGACGAAASIGTGAALVLTAPAWLPGLGGTAVVALGTVALWSGIGAGIGASVSGLRAYHVYRRQEEEFQAAFPPSSKPKDPNE